MGWLDHDFSKIAILVFFLVAAILLFLPVQYDQKDEIRRRIEKIGNRIQIVVLGDVGRSPRMQYHALSVAKNGGYVDLVGYKGSDILPEILSSPKITVHHVPRTPEFLESSDSRLFMLFAPFKVLFQCCSLWYIVAYKTEPAKWMLVQNPPAIPTLMIAQFACFLRCTSLIIDWHNFGYSVLTLKLGRSHPLVFLSQAYERYFSRAAFAHLTVTNAMSRALKEQYHVSTPVFPLHDRPASIFQPLSPLERFTFLGNFAETGGAVEDIAKGKTKIIVSPTSWTRDEDFSIFLEALVGYSDLATSSHPHLPEIIAVITGKGPQKTYYESQIAALVAKGKLEMVTVKTAWLSTGDYAKLLGAADLGVSLHTSSSGVDLPMKVVDMFGAGLPVIGWSKFEAWPELVTEGVNGKGFGSAGELQDLLVQLLGNDSGGLEKMKEGAVREGDRRWDDEWSPVAGKLLGVC